MSEVKTPEMKQVGLPGLESPKPDFVDTTFLPHHSSNPRSSEKPLASNNGITEQKEKNGEKIRNASKGTNVYSGQWNENNPPHILTKLPHDIKFRILFEDRFKNTISAYGTPTEITDALKERGLDGNFYLITDGKGWHKF